MKQLNVRHELPLNALNNFMDFYAKLLSKQKVICDTMVASGAKFTQWASMVIRVSFDESKKYEVRYVNDIISEVSRRDQNKRNKRVNWATKWCSCYYTRLTGLPCRYIHTHIHTHTLYTNTLYTYTYRHLLAVYIIWAEKTSMGSMDYFLDTFAFIPHFYVISTYVGGYRYQVQRPALTHLEFDDTLPPCEAETKKRGRVAKKRLLGRAERNHAPLPGVTVAGKKVSYVKTKGNIHDKRLEPAMQAQAELPERSLRSTLLEEEAEAAEDTVKAARTERSLHSTVLAVTDMVLNM
jgi:hypothetical protein